MNIFKKKPKSYDVGEINIEDFKNHLIALGRTNKTIESYVSYARKVTNPVSQAQINNIINQHNNRVCKAALINLLRWLGINGIQIHIKSNEPRPPPKGLSKDEFNRLIVELNDNKYQLAARVLVESAFRVGEVIRNEYDVEKGLRPNSIDGCWINLKLKRGRWDKALLSQGLINDLWSYINDYGLKDDDYVFDYSYHAFYHAMNRAADRSLNRHFNIHLLKHTFSRWCDEAGIPFDEKSLLMHHVNRNTTWRHYHNPPKTHMWLRVREGF